VRTDLGRSGSTRWPLDAALRTRSPQLVTDLAERFGSMPGGIWPEPAHNAVLLPLSKSGQEELAGFLVAGVSPRRAYDDAYRDFVELVGSQVATSIANARAYEDESSVPSRSRSSTAPRPPSSAT
jgi:GAF domain-containing protein